MLAGILWGLEQQVNYFYAVFAFEKEIVHIYFIWNSSILKINSIYVLPSKGKICDLLSLITKSICAKVAPRIYVRKT